MKYKHYKCIDSMHELIRIDEFGEVHALDVPSGSWYYISIVGCGLSWYKKMYSPQEVIELSEDEVTKYITILELTS